MSIEIFKSNNFFHVKLLETKLSYADMLSFFPLSKNMNLSAAKLYNFPKAKATFEPSLRHENMIAC